MNAPIQPERPPHDLQLVREVAALVLLLLGVAGLVTCAFVLHPLAGAAALSLLLAVTGLFLSTGRG